MRTVFNLERKQGQWMISTSEILSHAHDNKNKRKLLFMAFLLVLYTGVLVTAFYMASLWIVGALHSLRDSIEELKGKVQACAGL